MINESRVIKHLSLADDNTVTIQFRGSLQVIEAKALDHAFDDQGQLCYALLDRLIHKHDEHEFQSRIGDQIQRNIQVSGCYVTELKR